jgi:hypothetical protein
MGARYRPHLRVGAATGYRLPVNAGRAAFRAAKRRDPAIRVHSGWPATEMVVFVFCIVRPTNTPPREPVRVSVSRFRLAPPQPQVGHRIELPRLG